MITFDEKDFIINALNAYWNDANAKLQRKDLGDIERKNYEYQLSNSKRLMEKLEQLHKPDVGNSKAAIPEINDGQFFSCNGVMYMIQSAKQATDRGNLENGHNIFTFY